jgi:hypothetical protein
VAHVRVTKNAATMEEPEGAVGTAAGKARCLHCGAVFSAQAEGDYTECLKRPILVKPSSSTGGGVFGGQHSPTPVREERCRLVTAGRAALEPSFIAPREDWRLRLHHRQPPPPPPPAAPG